MIKHDASFYLASDADGALEELGRFPATSCQSRYWRAQSASPTSTSLNIAFRLELSGRVEAPAIERSLQRLVARHEILRTGFALEGGELVQIVHARTTLALQVHDLSRLAPAECAAEAERIGRQEARKPFDLACRSFVRATWLREQQGRGELLLTFHSLVLDGWSFAILVRELVSALEEEAGGQASAFEPVELHHGDYALWKQALLQSESMDASRAYWREELAGCRQFEVATDHPRSQRSIRDSVIASQLLPGDLTERLLARGRESGVTLFNQAFAALVLSLAQRESAPEIMVSTQVSTRDQQELEPIVGPLSNSVVLRIARPLSLSSRELLAACADKANSAITHGQIPFEELADLAQVAPDRSGRPLCAVNLTLQQSFVGMGDEVAAPHVAARLLRSYDVGALYDLSFFMVARAEGWRISCDGDTGLYDETTLDRLLSDWRAALGRIADGDVAEPASRSTGPAPAVVAPPAATPVDIAKILDNVITYHSEAPGTPVMFLNNTAVLYDLSERLAPHRPLIDIPMAPPGGPRELADRKFEDIAADTVALVRAIRPSGPYIFMGHCVLGSLGLEVAKQLDAQGEPVELVVLNDSWVPGYREDMAWHDRLLRRMQVQAYYLPKDFARWRRGELSLLQYLGQYRVLHALGVISAGIRLGWLRGDATEYAVPENRWYTDYLLRQQSRYRPVRYVGDVQIFRSQEPRKGRLFARDFGWAPVVSGRLDVHEIPTMHDTMFRQDGAAAIGAVLNRRLARAPVRSSDQA